MKMKQVKLSLTEDQIMYVNQKVLLDKSNFSTATRNLLQERIDMGEKYKEMKQNIELLEKIFSLEIYLKELLQQMYSDMDLEGGTNQKQCKALKKINDKRYKDPFNE